MCTELLVGTIVFGWIVNAFFFSVMHYDIPEFKTWMRVSIAIMVAIPWAFTAAVIGGFTAFIILNFAMDLFNFIKGD